MEITQLLIVALMAEAVWETLKMLWQSGKFSVDRSGALAVGLLLAIGTRLDLLAFVNIPVFIPYLGVILTGILISRGANFIHDLLRAAANINN